MKKRYLMGLLLCTAVLSGCATRSDFTAISSKNVNQKKEPQFLGWDKNGYKQFDNDSTKSRNTQSTIIGNNAVILNEDTILCETDTPLSQLYLEFKEPDKYPATWLIKNTTMLIDSYREMVKLDREMRAINRELRRLGDKQETSDSLTPPTNPENAKEFLRLCTTNKTPTPVEVIEVKPISKIAKIKVTLNNTLAELWTYQSHLTFPNTSDNTPALNQSVEKQSTSNYQVAPPTQQTAQPVVEQTAPTYQTYQQPQTGQSGTDLRSCLALVDNNAIAECVRKSKR